MAEDFALSGRLGTQPQSLASPLAGPVFQPFGCVRLAGIDHADRLVTVGFARGGIGHVAVVLPRIERLHQDRTVHPVLVHVLGEQLQGHVALGADGGGSRIGKVRGRSPHVQVSVHDHAGLR